MPASLANGSNSPHNGSSPSSLEEQLAAFADSDRAREALMQRLLNDNRRLQQENQEVQNDLSNERMSRRQWQSQAEGARSELSRHRSQLDDGAFTLALIDGDGCIFQEHLLRAAGDGGAEAAHLLNNEIRQLLHDRHGSIPGRAPIMVHIYANFEDLSRKLASVGSLTTAGDFGVFARSFSLNQPLFNFIDVGRGKERADHKIKELFRLFVNNTHCKHIIFGGCHDNGYLLNLEPYKRDPNVAPRMMLLETTDAEWQYKNLGFPLVRFASVFRDRPLPDGRVGGNANTYGGGHSPPATALPSSIVTTHRDTPADTPAAPAQPPAPKSPSPLHQGSATWAAVGGPTDGRNKTISIAPAKDPKAQRRYALFNRENERIDMKLPKPGQDAEMRFNVRVHKSGKTCNNFHLRGNCKAGPACTYSHDPLLSPEQRLVLLHRARSTPCGRGTRCTDVLCYLGHSCPNASCTRPDCFFKELHGIDTTPVLKVYEDDEVEILPS